MKYFIFIFLIASIPSLIYCADDTYISPDYPYIGEDEYLRQKNIVQTIIDHPDKIDDILDTLEYENISVKKNMNKALKLLKAFDDSYYIQNDTLCSLDPLEHMLSCSNHFDIINEEIFDAVVINFIKIDNKWRFYITTIGKSFYLF